MDHYLVYIRLYFWILAGNWQTSLSDVLELWCHTVSNQMMRPILSSPVTRPDAVDACMGTILSSAPLPTHESCRVSTIHFPTVRQQFNPSPRYTVSAFHPLLYFLYHVECLLPLGQVVPLDKDIIDRDNPLLQTLSCNDLRTHRHWKSHFFLSSYCVRACSCCSILQSSPIRWKNDMNKFRKLDLFWRGLNLCNPASIYYFV